MLEPTVAFICTKLLSYLLPRVWLTLALPSSIHIIVTTTQRGAAQLAESEVDVLSKCSRTRSIRLIVVSIAFADRHQSSILFLASASPSTHLLR